MKFPSTMIRYFPIEEAKNDEEEGFPYLGATSHVEFNFFLIHTCSQK